MIKLYTYNGSPNIVFKKLPTGSIVAADDVQTNHEVELMDPFIKSTKSPLSPFRPNPAGGAYNYASINDRYYFVTNWTENPNGLVTIQLHLDVLMTYRNLIDNLYVEVERSGSNQQSIAHYEDSERMFPSTRNYSVTQFPNGFSENEADGLYLLTVSQSGYKPVGGTP